jgi:hypothetical protein
MRRAARRAPTPSTLGIIIPNDHHGVMKRLKRSKTVPKPQDAPVGEEDRPDPTRYGDWEKKGIAVDF